MDFDEVVRNRKSVRSFTDGKVGWRNIMDAVDSALQGPFAGNQNNLKFLIVEDKERIKEISAVCEQIWIAEAGALIVVCSEETHLENAYGERGRIYCRQQAGAVIQTVLFKLIDIGLSACWIGAYDDDALRRKLEIPKEILIEAIIPLGYQKGDVKKPNKKSLESALFWEKWGKTKRTGIFEEEKEDYRPMRIG
ncbi:nitroreductase family protein [Candidatus Pacearchaeota archaeon]|nr:nitroreductase family protein [Candidatus Pacearchaeota archaeon]